MVALYGTYRFQRKRVGARKDFCHACERECIAEQWQSFDCGHLFFVPLLPLGTRTRWRCSLCGKDPRARYKTKTWLRILGLIVLPFPALILFVGPDSPTTRPSDAAAPYGMAVIFGGAWLILLYSTLKRDDSPSGDRRRTALSPLGINSCLYCRTPLVSHPDPHCPTCGVRFDAVEPSLPPPLPPPLLST